VKRTLWLFTVALLCISSTLAQQPLSNMSGVEVPHLVQFGGIVRDSAGRTLSGNVGITFALYKDQEGGTTLWVETQNVALDKSGKYAVELGATSASGLPTDLFNSGVARWLGVRVNGGEEQPRVLLLSVPYALKAGDAETIGGLPPTAFVLAAPATSGMTVTESAPVSPGTATATVQPPATGNTPVTTAGGTSGKIPVWDSTSDITSSVMSQSTINSVPQISVNGNLALPNNGAATKTSGKKSRPLTLTSSAYNSTTAAAVNQIFQWQSEPAGNNTATPSGTLNLLFGSGSTTPGETGLKISSKGIFSFASGQTFPGTGPGTITGVTAGTDLTGGGTGGNVTMNLDTTKVPQLAAANTFTGNQTVNGNLSATGFVTGSGYQIGSNLFASGSYTNGNAFLGFAGNATTTGDHNTASGLWALFSNTTGLQNTASGYAALYSNTTGNYNTASGVGALNYNISGNYNTASGNETLYHNTTGSYNTASGFDALFANTEGLENTASGFKALYSNITGKFNTASGFDALFSNTTGNWNTASGVEVLYRNTTGVANTASGADALFANTTGEYNTACGFKALYSNTTGINNTACGDHALYMNTDGFENVAYGEFALYSSTGSLNTAIGYGAGRLLTSGSNNTYISNIGVESESNTIRIGEPSEITAFYVAGVKNATVTSGQPVYIGSDGRLGTVPSSRRYKDNIEDIGNASNGLLALRPVTFRYKQAAPDGSKPLQYGLIAEEVAAVFPDAVLYNDSGQPDSVEYHKINAMLLNEVQRQHREIEDLKESLSQLQSLVRSQLGK
jgi:hypothetical protein